MEKEAEDQKDTAESRDAILVNALKLFAEKGYFNTSLTDIKEKVGVKNSIPITRHFKTKQAIASELHSSILDNLNVSIDDIRRRNKKVVDQLREIVDLMFTLTEEAPEIMRFLLLLNIPEFLPQEQPIHESKPFQKIQKIIQVGIESGEIRVLDPAIIFSQFFGIIFQALIMIITGPYIKNSNSYQASAWVAAWNCIAKV